MAGELENLLSASFAMEGKAIDADTVANAWYEASQQAIVTIANEMISKIEPNADTTDAEIEKVVDQCSTLLKDTVAQLVRTALYEKRNGMVQQ